MKIKKISLITLMCGILLTVVGVIVPYFRAVSVNIIGGSGLATYRYFFFNYLSSSMCFITFLGVALTLSSLFCLMFSKTVLSYCSIKTTAISLGLSAVGAIGLLCVLVWFTCVAFGEQSKHPIAYPTSIILGIICLCAFIALIFIYLKFRNKIWSFIGLAIDVLTSIIWVPTLFFAFIFIHNLAQSFI